MDYMKAYCCLLLIFARQIVCSNEIRTGKELWLFHLNNDIKVSGNSTQRERFTQPITMNLNVSFLPMTKSFHENLQSFCDVLTKAKVLAILFPPDLANKTGLTLAAKHLAIPVLNLLKSSQDIPVIN